MFILVNLFSKIYLYIQNKYYFMPAHFLLSPLLFACWEIFHDFFMLFVDFFQSQLFPKRLSGTPSESNSLNPDQICQPDLGPNCLQRLSADNMELKSPS